MIWGGMYGVRFYEQDPLKKVTGPPRTITIQQCSWTNCNDNCPSGWQEMVDSTFATASLLNIIITDETGCDGDGYHKFCCPVTSNPPKCKWTPQFNGKCQGSCSSGYTEVGSSSKYCDGAAFGQAQALCCTYDDTNQAIGSTALYGTCLWSQWPSCDSGSCPAGFPRLTSSTTKNGGALCNPRVSGVIDGFYGVSSYQEAD